ncbi:hypothetical protein SNE40_020797 [Patella caerulea]
MEYTGLVEKLTETITENNKRKRPTPEQKPAKKKKTGEAGYKKDGGDSTINRIETHSNIENPSEIHQLEQIADLPNRFGKYLTIFCAVFHTTLSSIVNLRV